MDQERRTHFLKRLMGQLNEGCLDNYGQTVAYIPKEEIEEIKEALDLAINWNENPVQKENNYGS